jgi:pimeloyl-ACP methyl ester carboxylesterase
VTGQGENMPTIIVVIALMATFVCSASDALAQDKFFMSNGVRLRYVERSTGQPVVLLHGNAGWIEESWSDPGVIDALAKRYRVIALDQRGYGKSDKPHDPSAYGAAMGDDLVNLLDHLAIDRAHVIGYSMGARITSWLIVNRPQRLMTATLGGPSNNFDTPEQRRTLEVQANEAKSDLINPERMKRNNPGMSDAQVAEFIARRAPMNDPQAVAAYYRGSPGLFITKPALRATRVPVLIVIGSLDTTRLPAARDLRDNVLPSAEFLVVPGATHVDVPRRKEFVEAIEKFLAHHSSGS